MVIISAVICDKQGSIYLARQFQGITQLQLMEQIRSFPKLISATQQHTFIDHDSIRYIYTPIDTLYLLLMTTKNSNRIEDLEVIRILKINPENIKKQTFEILLAIDDVISAGLRESTSISQVQSALEMESSEEKLHIMLTKARENEAKELAKKHQLEMERKRQEELAKKGKPKPAFSTAAFSNPQPDPFEQQQVPQLIKAMSNDEQNYSSANAVLSKNVKSVPKKGMQLGKKKQDNMFEQE